MRRKQHTYRLQSILRAFSILCLLCGISYAAPLTEDQLNNINTESDINVNIWTIKGSYRDIQALAAIVDQQITTLQTKGINVPKVNWSDLTMLGSVNWYKYGYGTQ